MNLKKTFLLCFIILLVSVIATVLIFFTEPTASQSGASVETATLVDVVQVEKGTFTPTIRATGTVEPSQDITLSPRVEGEVIERSDNFTPGGYVEEGEMLLQIDPSDYENTLQQRRSELQRAEADLAMEMGQQNVAEHDYALLGDSLTSLSRSLVLREPQLNTARSMVQSAESAVRQAELDLQRTTIRAPFDAYIISRNTNVGSQVSPGDELGRLVGLETYWVSALVPVSSLRWLSIPENGGDGAEVRIRNRTAWDEDEHRIGQVYRLIGALEDQTRMARVLITVPDALSNQAENEDQPRLMIGAFVEAGIQGNELIDVVRVNRDYVRQNNRVWVMEDNTLRIRDVNILFEDSQYAYVIEGLEDGSQVVTTNLSTVVDGSRLRLDEESESSEESANETE